MPSDKPEADDDTAAAGAVPPMKTSKAGCGIRIDPDTLNEDVGFDFSGASELKPEDEIDKPGSSES